MEEINIVFIFVIVVLLLSCHIYREGLKNEVSYVYSSIDNNKYLVRNKEDKEAAADMLAILAQKLKFLINNLYKKFPENKGCGRMKDRFSINNISESSHRHKYTSYSVNKGEKIVFCLRERNESESLHDNNTLMFVALHELAHLMTKSNGHTKEFWKNFAFLIKHAVKMKIYDYQDFRNNPVEYCGTEITDTPIDYNDIFTD